MTAGGSDVTQPPYPSGGGSGVCACRAHTSVFKHVHTESQDYVICIHYSKKHVDIFLEAVYLESNEIEYSFPCDEFGENLQKTHSCRIGLKIALEVEQCALITAWPIPAHWTHWFGRRV